MKIEIVYFSGTGNTWWMVQKLKSFLEEKGDEVEIIPYESRERENYPTKNAQLFGVAFPVYEGGSPINMEEYAYKLKARKGLKCFVLTTYWIHNQPAPTDYAHLLKKRGMEPIFTTGIKMPMNVNLSIFPVSKKSTFTKKQKIAKIKEEALTHIEEIAMALHNGKKVGIDKIGFFQNIWYQGSRWAHYQILNKKGIKWINKRLKVSENCIKCGKCVEECPVQNIVMTDKGIEFKNRCIVCARCWNFCPQKAIYIKDIPFGQYMGINEGYKPPKIENNETRVRQGDVSFVTFK